MTDPSDEEMAAIMVAVLIAWPQPAPAAPPDQAPNRWKFSGRWWTRPSPTGRERHPIR